MPPPHRAGAAGGSSGSVVVAAKSAGPSPGSSRATASVAGAAVEDVSDDGGAPIRYEVSFSKSSRGSSNASLLGGTMAPQPPPLSASAQLAAAKTSKRVLPSKRGAEIRKGIHGHGEKQPTSSMSARVQVKSIDVTRRESMMVANTDGLLGAMTPATTAGSSADSPRNVMAASSETALTPTSAAGSVRSVATSSSSRRVASGYATVTASPVSAEPHKTTGRSADDGFPLPIPGFAAPKGDELSALGDDSPPAASLQAATMAPHETGLDANTYSPASPTSPASLMPQTRSQLKPAPPPLTSTRSSPPVGVRRVGGGGGGGAKQNKRQEAAQRLKLLYTQPLFRLMIVLRVVLVAVRWRRIVDKLRWSVHVRKVLMPKAAFRIQCAYRRMVSRGRIRIRSAAHVLVNFLRPKAIRLVITKRLCIATIHRIVDGFQERRRLFAALAQRRRALVERVLRRRIRSHVVRRDLARASMHEDERILVDEQCALELRAMLRTERCAFGTILATHYSELSALRNQLEAELALRSEAEERHQREAAIQREVEDKNRVAALQMQLAHISEALSRSTTTRLEGPWSQGATQPPTPLDQVGGVHPPHFMRYRPSMCSLASLTSLLSGARQAAANGSAFTSPADQPQQLLSQKSPSCMGFKSLALTDGLTKQSSFLGSAQAATLPMVLRAPFVPPSSPAALAAFPSSNSDDDGRSGNALLGVSNSSLTLPAPQVQTPPALATGGATPGSASSPPSSAGFSPRPPSAGTMTTMTGHAGVLTEDASAAVLSPNLFDEPISQDAFTPSPSHHAYMMHPSANGDSSVFASSPASISPASSPQRNMRIAASVNTGGAAESPAGSSVFFAPFPDASSGQQGVPLIRANSKRRSMRSVGSFFGGGEKHTPPPLDDVQLAFMELLSSTESLERKSRQAVMLQSLGQMHEHIRWCGHVLMLRESTPRPFVNLLPHLNPVWILRRGVQLFRDEAAARAVIVAEYDATPVMFLSRPLIGIESERRRQQMKHLLQQRAQRLLDTHVRPVTAPVHALPHGPNTEGQTNNGNSNDAANSNSGNVASHHHSRRHTIMHAHPSLLVGSSDHGAQHSTTNPLDLQSLVAVSEGASDASAQKGQGVGAFPLERILQQYRGAGTPTPTSRRTPPSQRQRGQSPQQQQSATNNSIVQDDHHNRHGPRRETVIALPAIVSGVTLLSPSPLIPQPVSQHSVALPHARWTQRGPLPMASDATTDEGGAVRRQTIIPQPTTRPAAVLLSNSSRSISRPSRASAESTPTTVTRSAPSAVSFEDVAELRGSQHSISPLKYLLQHTNGGRSSSQSATTAAEGAKSDGSAARVSVFCGAATPTAKLQKGGITAVTVSTVFLATPSAGETPQQRSLDEAPLNIANSRVSVFSTSSRSSMCDMPTLLRSPVQGSVGGGYEMARPSVSFNVDRSGSTTSSGGSLSTNAWRQTPSHVTVPQRSFVPLQATEQGGSRLPPPLLSITCAVDPRNSPASSATTSHVTGLPRSPHSTRSPMAKGKRESTSATTVTTSLHWQPSSTTVSGIDACQFSISSLDGSVIDVEQPVSTGGGADLLLARHQ